MDGSVYAGFKKLVLLTCTVVPVGEMSNTAGVVVEEVVTSNPEDPVKFGCTAPASIILESSTRVTIDGSVAPTGSITTGGRDTGPMSTTDGGRPPMGM
ncbi:Uncharacterised protein [Chlamydia trachomatis]|nr:Uncharacterised protein [Chlamydia trachomatis]